MRCRIAIDAVGAKHSGAAAVLLGIVGAALDSTAVSHLTVFCSPAKQREFRLPDDGKLNVVDVPLGERGFAGRALWQHVGLRSATRADGAQVLLCLSGGGLAATPVPTVQFIQQSLPFSREALATVGYRDFLRARTIGWNMRVSAVRSTGVAVQTETMKRWVVEQLGIETSRVRVFEPTVEPDCPSREAGKPAEERQTGGNRRFLYVGNTSPYKNLVVLQRAMERLAERRPGTRLLATIPAKHPLASAPGVEALGRVPPTTLWQTYRSVTALIMPSLVETVGLPMLEAMAVGTPVIAADRPYAREVCRDAALYFDPWDHEELAERLATVSADASLREAMSRNALHETNRRAASPGDAELVSWLVSLAGHREGLGTPRDTGGEPAK